MHLNLKLVLDMYVSGWCHSSFDEVAHQSQTMALTRQTNRDFKFAQVVKQGRSPIPAAILVNILKSLTSYTTEVGINRIAASIGNSFLLLL